MTAIDLLESLKEYIRGKTEDLQLWARVPEDGTESARRPPKVFTGNLPEKEDEKKAAPYILLKLLTTKSEDEERTAMVRIIVVTYSEDKEENYIQCLNVLSLLERVFLEDGMVANRYSCQKPIETLMYDEDFEVYQIGEMMTTWELPQIERNVRQYV